MGHVRNGHNSVELIQTPEHFQSDVLLVKNKVTTVALKVHNLAKFDQINISREIWLHRVCICACICFF